MEIYENLSNIQSLESGYGIDQGDYLTDYNENTIATAFDDGSESDDGWGDDFAEDSADELAEDYYGNLDQIINPGDNEVTEEGFYDLPEDENNGPPPPDIVRSLKPGVTKKQPPKPLAKPNIKPKPRIGSYDNHKLKIPAQRKPVDNLPFNNQSNMVKPFSRKQKDTLSKTSTRPPLSISPPKPHIVGGQVYVPSDDVTNSELVYEIENEREQEDNGLYIDPNNDPSISTCPFPTRTLPSTPDAMSGKAFLNRLDTMRKKSQERFVNNSQNNVIEESDYEICGSTHETNHSSNSSSKFSSKESSGDSCDITMRVRAQQSPIIESDQYEILGENQMACQQNENKNASFDIRNRPRCPLPTELGNMVLGGFPQASTFVQRSNVLIQDNIQEEYEYVPTEPQPIFPPANVTPDLPTDDSYYEPAEAKSLFEKNENSRKESCQYISPITCHVGNSGSRPVIPERQKEPVKLPIDKPSRPPRKPERESKENQTPPSVRKPIDPPVPKRPIETPLPKRPTEHSYQTRPTEPPHLPLRPSEQSQPRDHPHLPLRPSEQPHSAFSTKQYERYDPTAKRQLQRVPSKPEIDRSNRPVPSLPERNPILSTNIPPRPAPVSRREMPLPETPSEQDTPNIRPSPNAVISPDLNTYSWFRPSCSIAEAKQILNQSATEGDFIIRPSQNSRDNYSISIYANGKITHLKVPFVDGSYRLGSSPQTFRSVPELIRFYQQTRVVFTSGGSALLRS